MSARIRIAIRADAGAAIGTGHFARMGAVARALAASNAIDTVLVTSQSGADLAPAFFPSATRVLTLDDGHNGPGAVMDRLGRQFGPVDALCLDQYGHVDEWEFAAGAAGTPLMVFDDLDEATSADLIVRTHGTIGSAGTTILSGPAFVPLGRHVTETVRNPRRGRLRLNICFGGSDPTGETAKAVEAVTALEEIAVDLVIGPRTQLPGPLLQVAKGQERIAVHHAPAPARIAALLGTADMALGGGGVMLWERLFLGVPSLVVEVAENQRKQIELCARAGAIRAIGEARSMNAQAMAAHIRDLATDSGARGDMQQAGMALVDGRGAIRVAGSLASLALAARPATRADGADMLAWRTDPANWQYNWSEAEKPDLAQHLSWLNERLADPDGDLRVVELHGQPVGVTRFELSDAGRTAYLSIYLVPEWHGRKLGLAVYYAGERALRQSHSAVERVISRIHVSNIASGRLHRDAGFTVTPSPGDDVWLEAEKRLA